MGLINLRGQNQHKKGQLLPRKTRLYIKANIITECNVAHLSIIFTYYQYYHIKILSEDWDRELLFKITILMVLLDF